MNWRSSSSASQPERWWASIPEKFICVRMYWICRQPRFEPTSVGYSARHQWTGSRAQQLSCLRKCAEFQNPTLNFRTLLTSSKSYQFWTTRSRSLPVPGFQNSYFFAKTLIFCAFLQKTLTFAQPPARSRPLQSSPPCFTKRSGVLNKQKDYREVST